MFEHTHFSTMSPARATRIRNNLRRFDESMAAAGIARAAIESDYPDDESPPGAAAPSPARTVALVTGAELAGRLRISADSVRRMARDKILPCIVVRGKRRFDPAGCIEALRLAAAAADSPAARELEGDDMADEELAATAPAEAASEPQDASASEPAEVSADEPNAAAVAA